MKIRLGSMELPATVGTEGAAELLGSSVDTLQRLAGSGQLPVEPLRVGSRLRWPVARIAEALGLPVEFVEEDSG